MDYLRGFLLLLVVNATYFVLTDSASLHGMQLIPFQIWVAILLGAIIVFSYDILGGRTDPLSTIFRFVIWLSLFIGVLLVLFPSGSTLSPVVLWTLLLLNVCCIGMYGYFVYGSDFSQGSKIGWFAYLVFLFSFSILTVSALLKLGEAIVLALFVVGELAFLGGVSVMIRDMKPKHLILLALTALGAGGFGWGASKSDVMFLVSNLIITRTVGSLSLEGVVGGTFLYFLMLIQFSVVFVLLLLKKRYDLVALGLTGVTFTFPPLLAIRSVLLLHFMQGQAQGGSDPQLPQMTS